MHRYDRAMSHSASRTILATPRAIFRAHLDPKMLVKWRAPAGMSLRIEAFDPRIGGRYRMAFLYAEPNAAQPKSSDDSDILEGHFIELVPDERIVEAVRFESDEPAFQGTMTVTTVLIPVAGGTKVSIIAENVPAGISEADHHKGMDASLKNLAALLE
jgi:uncharacterized protein YndB with AHSA1/START domain